MGGAVSDGRSYPDINNLLVAILIIGVFHPQPLVAAGSVPFPAKPCFSFSSCIVSVFDFSNTHQITKRLVPMAFHFLDGSRVAFDRGLKRVVGFFSWRKFFSVFEFYSFHFTSGMEETTRKENIIANTIEYGICRAGINTGKSYLNSISILIFKRMNDYFRSVCCGEFLAGNFLHQISNDAKGHGRQEKEACAKGKPKGILLHLFFARVISICQLVFSCGVVCSTFSRENLNLFVVGRTFASRVEFFCVTGGLIGLMMCISVGLFVYVWTWH